MNKAHHMHTPHKSERGTTRAYITGFWLSLIFTAIPYLLVVNKLMTGKGLLVTILGIGVLQMLIQVFFFLHLGRGPKPFYNVVFFVGAIGTILVVVGGSVFIMNNLHYNMSPSEVTTRLSQDENISEVGSKDTGACQGTYTNHRVTISKGVLSPTHTTAHRCDTLTFLNEDSRLREIGFGSHPNHTGYSGQDDLLAKKGVGVTITLNKTGNYEFHDHLDPAVVGDFTVAD